MVKRKKITLRQIAVLEDLFDSRLGEKGVLKKHGVRQSTYDRWLMEEPFVERFSQYINRARRRIELFKAKNWCKAVKKLANLTKSKNEETARKVCLDIIKLTRAGANKNDGGGMRDERREPGAEINQSNIEFSPETAGKLLAVLAADKK